VSRAATAASVAGSTSPAGGAPQRGDAQRRELVVPQEQPEQAEQVGEAVVNRRRGDEQHPRCHDELRERAVAPRVRVTKAVGLVDDKKAVRGGNGR